MKRLTQILFFLFILFLPTQLGRHFWLPQSLVLGRRIDYLSPTVYLEDILVCLLFIIVGWTNRKEFSIKKTLPLVSVYALLCICFVFPTQNFITALFFFWRLVEIGLIVWIISRIKPQISQVLVPLSFAIGVSVFLAVLQFLHQGSLGGLWWWLGERTFALSTPAISQFIVDGRLLLRPYATFPHPNVFGGFLVIVLPLFLLWKTETRVHYMLKRLTLGFLCIGIGISFSRTAWMGMVIVLLFSLFKNKEAFLKALTIISLLILIEELLFGRIGSLLTTDTISLTQRRDLAVTALSLFTAHPIFGVGLSQFIYQIPSLTTPPYLLQPVHSIYLLILSETGIVGACLFIWVLFFLMKKLRYLSSSALTVSFLVMLFLGLFDHYLITLPQGQLLVAVVVGMSLVQQ